MLLPASKSPTGQSLAQRFAAKPRRNGAGYTLSRMLETGKRERLRALPAVDAVLRDPAGAALVERSGRGSATAAVRSVLEEMRRAISAGESPDASVQNVAALAARSLADEGLRRVVNSRSIHASRNRLNTRMPNRLSR